MDLFEIKKNLAYLAFWYKPIYAYATISTKGMSSTDGHSSYVINYVVQGNQVFQLLASLNRDGVIKSGPCGTCVPCFP